MTISSDFHYGDDSPFGKITKFMLVRFLERATFERCVVRDADGEPVGLRVQVEDDDTTWMVPIARQPESQEEHASDVQGAHDDQDLRDAGAPDELPGLVRDMVREEFTTAWEELVDGDEIAEAISTAVEKIAPDAAEEAFNQEPFDIAVRNVINSMDLMDGKDFRPFLVDLLTADEGVQQAVVTAILSRHTMQSLLLRSATGIGGTPGATSE